MAVQLYASLALAYSKSSVLFSLVGQSTNCLNVKLSGDHNESILVPCLKSLRVVAEWMSRAAIALADGGM